MSPEAIVAIVATVVAVSALYFNWRSAQSAALAAQAAKDQVEIQRQVQIDASQPYVWADLRPDEATGTLINLVVGNTGPTIAQNVQVSFDPPIRAIEQLRTRAEAAQRVLSEGLKSLPPGRIYMWPLGQGFNLVREDEAQVYKISVSFDGPFGAVPAIEYVVDMAALRGVLDRPAGSMHQLTIAVQEVAKSLPNAYIPRGSSNEPDPSS